MNINSLIALEGIGSTGKTSLIGILNDCGLSTICEISDGPRYIREYPSFTLDENEMKKANEWFVQKEIERLNRASELLRFSSVVMDRFYLSQLAYNYARDKKYKSRSFSYAKRLILENLKGAMHPHIVYLDGNPEMSEKKTRDRFDVRVFKYALLGKEAFAEYDVEFFSYMRYYYKEVLRRLDDTLTLNLDCALELNANKILQWVGSLNSSNANYDLELLMVE